MVETWAAGSRTPYWDGSPWEWALVSGPQAQEAILAPGCTSPRSRGNGKLPAVVWRDAVGQYWIFSGQHIAEAYQRISREYMNAHVEPPTWSVQFLAQVVRTDVTLHIRESIAGMSQVYRL